MNAQNSCTRYHLMCLLFLIISKVSVTVCHGKLKIVYVVRTVDVVIQEYKHRYRSCYALYHMRESEHLLYCKFKSVFVNICEKLNPGDLT